MKIPNGNRAYIGTKLEDYVLNSAHKEGQHKARVFNSTLGINLANAQVLRNALLHAVMFSEDAEFRGDNGFGSAYSLRFSFHTTKGTATVLSA